MDNHECEECGYGFTSRGNFEQVEADVVEQEVCDTVDGQYIEYLVVHCPRCNWVVEEYGR